MEERRQEGGVDYGGSRDDIDDKNYGRGKGGRYQILASARADMLVKL